MNNKALYHNPESFYRMRVMKDENQNGDEEDQQIRPPHEYEDEDEGGDPAPPPANCGGVVNRKRYNPAAPSPRHLETRSSGSLVSGCVALFHNVPRPIMATL